MAKHGVVRTDKLMGTDVRSMLVSLNYIVITQDDQSQDVSTETAIDNGNFVKLGALKEDEREIYLATAPAASDALADVVLVASPEVMYDERLKDLADFYNEAGKNARGYRLHSGDIFSLTAEALSGTTGESGTLAVGSIVELQAGTKLKAVASGTSGSTAIGKIIAIDVVGPHTYYVIQVD